ncbi:HNH endonuclease signature motif containing protein [Nocardiopsis sp. FR26]|uniref:HNH endonuclease signature motif containing protein n=1 Tax=Nocardiopsis sp. FR26 TaxID=2605987 RepID=UPI0013568E7B
MKDDGRFRESWKTSNNGCWEWCGRLSDKGYGWFWDSANKKHVKAHRWSYESSVAAIPEGLEIDHLCRNRACVNPGHLEPVTHAENVRRAKYLKTECVAGHPLPVVESGSRECQECARERKRAYKARQKAKQPPKEKKLPPHGRGRYAHHGCRCDICCEAEKSYKRAWREKQAVAITRTETTGA